MTLLNYRDDIYQQQVNESDYLAVTDHIISYGFFRDIYYFLLLFFL